MEICFSHLPQDEGSPKLQVWQNSSLVSHSIFVITVSSASPLGFLHICPCLRFKHSGSCWIPFGSNFNCRVSFSFTRSAAREIKLDISCSRDCTFVSRSHSIIEVSVLAMFILSVLRGVGFCEYAVIEQYWWQGEWAADHYKTMSRGTFCRAPYLQLLIMQLKSTTNVKLHTPHSLMSDAHIVWYFLQHNTTGGRMQMGPVSYGPIMTSSAISKSPIWYQQSSHNDVSKQ